MNEETKAAIEAATAAAASKVTMGGALATLWGWLASSQFVGVAGLGIAFAGLLVNWYFRARVDKREQKEHEARMRKLETRPGDLK